MNARSTVAAMAAGVVGSTKPLGIIDVDCDHPDAVIIHAWNRRQEAIAAIEARGRMYDSEEHSPAEQHLYDTLENGIPLLEATTPLGMLPKLWIAMHAAGSVIRNEEMRAQSDAINRGDYAEVSTFEHYLDWHERIIFALIGDALGAARRLEA